MRLSVKTVQAPAVLEQEENHMNVQLSDHFTYPKLFRFVLPSIVMMVFTSIYGVVDGVFVSNFAGKSSFAAINLIIPFVMVMGASGFMLGTGGSAYVAKTLGEGKQEDANRYFSMMVYVTIILGVVLAVVGCILIEPAAVLLGADETMLSDCVVYGRINLIALPAFMLQNTFQSFLVTAGRPHIGLAMTVAAGVTNMIFDALLIAVFSLGVAGAAIATAASQCVGGIAPLIYFARKNRSLLRLVKTRFEGRVLTKSCMNGSSELLTNISMSLVSMLYNFQLMRLAGQNGVAAYGVIMYVQFIFAAIFIGYSIGTAPIIGYNYGSGNHDELKNMFRKSLRIVLTTGAVLMVSAFGLSGVLAHIFAGYDRELFELTVRGFRIYSLSFFLCGISIFGSSFFTALNNGGVSAAISFLRTVVFQVATVLILPELWGVDGIWISIVVSEAASLLVTAFFFVRLKGRYHYA